MIAYGHFILPQGFVWVCMGEHTHFIAPEGDDNNVDDEDNDEQYLYSIKMKLEKY